MKIVRALALAVMLVPGAPAAAELAIKAQPESNQVVRFDRGTPTIEEDLPDQIAAVRVVPLGKLDHGSLTFNVAVYNKSRTAFNFGVENIGFAEGDLPLAVFSKDELEQRAKKRAMWSQIGYAMLAGAASAAQNNNVTVTAPGRPYRLVISRPGLSNGQLASAAAGGGAIALSQIGLRRTLETLNDQILQTTTLDPDAGYGGRIVCAKLKKPAIGEQVSLIVTINGEKHLFKFVVDHL